MQNLAQNGSCESTAELRESDVPNNTKFFNWSKLIWLFWLSLVLSSLTNVLQLMCHENGTLVLCWWWWDLSCRTMWLSQEGILACEWVMALDLEAQHGMDKWKLQPLCLCGLTSRERAAAALSSFKIGFKPSKARWVLPFGKVRRSNTIIPVVHQQWKHLDICVWSRNNITKLSMIGLAKLKFKYWNFYWDSNYLIGACCTVVVRLFRIQKVGGSIPSKSTFALLNDILFWPLEQWTWAVVELGIGRLVSK